MSLNLDPNEYVGGVYGCVLWNAILRDSLFVVSSRFHYDPVIHI